MASEGSNETTSVQPEQVDSVIPTKPPAATIVVKVQFGKNSKDLEVPIDLTVGELKAKVEGLHGIPPPMQKLMFKGMLKDDGATLEKVGIKPGAKILLIGTSPAELLATASAAVAVKSDMVWDNPVAAEEPLSKQQQHAKVIAKGRPVDGLEGLANRQIPLPEDVTSIPGLLNSQGNKVRLTFKPELQQLWIGSATSTQKVPYSMIARIDAIPIQDLEAYSIVSLQLGSTAQSKYWLYFVPSQYVSAIKTKILGLAGLL